MSVKTNWTKLTNIVKQIMNDNPNNFMTGWEEKKEDITQLLNKTIKKVKDTNTPKKPKSAYIFFCQSYRPTLLKSNPNLLSKNIMQEMGNVWKKLSQEEKSKYQKQSDDDKKRYTTEMTTYSETSPTKEESKTTKKISNYIIFCKLMRNQVTKDNPDFKQQDITRELGRMWKELSDSEKSSYAETDTVTTVINKTKEPKHKTVTGIKRKVEENLFDDDE